MKGEADLNPTLVGIMESASKHIYLFNLCMSTILNFGWPNPSCWKIFIPSSSTNLQREIHSLLLFSFWYSCAGFLYDKHTGISRVPSYWFARVFHTVTKTNLACTDLEKQHSICLGTIQKLYEVHQPVGTNWGHIPNLELG